MLTDQNPSYASSQEIQAYMKTVALKYDIHKSIHFNSKVVSAVWSQDKNGWDITLEDGRQAESELLINAGGILNNPQMPDIEGLLSFEGPALHTAAWDDSVDLHGKRIAVIGAGASAIQLLPQVQKIAKSVDVYIRTPSWISPPTVATASGAANYVYTEEEKLNFATDVQNYLGTRKGYEAMFNGMFRAFSKGSKEQRELKDQLESNMKRLIKDKELQERLIPSFEAGCRRISPGEPYLAALQQHNVCPIFESITSITRNGVVTSGGTERAVDVVILATGFNTTFRPRFPIIGRNGVNLQDLWAEEPTSYMGTGVSGFPNYLVFLGPNTPISNGSVIGREVYRTSSNRF
jgi:cation diffusion facilitator CzcD-associated flavoprotein CzcO